MTNGISPTFNEALFLKKILVVDDAAINRDLITGYLRSAGYLNLETAVDGRDALNKIFMSEPDLLILDLVMPNMDGVQVIKELRSNVKMRQLPILVQTAISDPEQRTDAWSCGATDIIIKPIHRIELLSRVNVQLENSFLIQELENYQRRAEQEISRALEVQQSLLPSPQVLQELSLKYALKIDSIYLPCRFLSGDMWGIYEAAPAKIIVWISDFSGKGIGASLYTLHLHAVIAEYKNRITDPELLLKILNKHLVEMIPIGQFCTCLIGLIDIEKAVFRYVSAGSTHPIIYDRQNHNCHLGDSTGMPLGICLEADYPVRQMDFKANQSLTLYSDLLWEDEGGIPDISLEPDELPKVMRKLNGKSIFNLVSRKLETLDGSQFSDDLTLIEIQR